MTKKRAAAALILSVLTLSACGGGNGNTSPPPSEDQQLEAAAPPSPAVTPEAAATPEPTYAAAPQTPETSPDMPAAPDVPQAEPEIEPAASDEPNENDIVPEAPSIAVNGLPLAKSDLVVSTAGGQIEFDQDINDVISILGDGYEYFEAISCAYDGLDKTYIFDGIEIYTYPDGENDFVVEMIVTGDSVETTRGVTVGDSRGDVIAAYGTDYTETAVMIEYEIDGSFISFSFDGDVVETIEYFR